MGNSMGGCRDGPIVISPSTAKTPTQLHQRVIKVRRDYNSWVYSA